MKRTPMTRTKPLRASQEPRASVPLLRKKKCGHCSELFRPFNPMASWCSPECGAALGLKKLEKKKAKEAAEDRRQTRAKREALKTLRELRAEAQAEFNRYIRHRDRLAGWGCICCGAPLNWDSLKPGGEVDAGHYMSRGSSIELAFDEINVNAQRKSCNRPGGATRAEFRAGMVARWGRKEVERLEGPHELPKLRHDDLRAIRDDYRKKANALEKELRK